MTLGKRVMFVNRRAPHGTLYAWEALDLAYVFAAFDQIVSLVFMDDGVYQIHRGQDTSGIGIKDFSPAYRAFQDHEIAHVYVEQESLEARALSASDLMIPVEIVNAQTLGGLMIEQDILLSF